MSAAVLTPARILMTGSRTWTNPEISSDALNAGLALLGAPHRGSTLIHGGARGADLLLKAEAEKLGLSTEAHPAHWNTHTDKCPDWDKPNAVCKLAGSRRNTEMIQTGAALCLAFPTHGYALAPGEDRKETSRGTWDCAESAMKTGLPTLVVWGRSLFPFGQPGMELLARHAATKGLKPGTAGELEIVDVWLPF